VGGVLVVALVDEEATVKYYRPKGDRVELIAANPAYEPIEVRPGMDFRVLGIVRGVIRTVSN
jgi:repressor LexA